MALTFGSVVGVAFALAAGGCAQAPSVGPVADAAPVVVSSPEPERRAAPRTAAETVEFSIDGVLHTCEEQGVGDYDCWEGSSSGVGLPDSYCSDGYDWCATDDYPWRSQQGGDWDPDASDTSGGYQSDDGTTETSGGYQWDDDSTDTSGGYQWDDDSTDASGGYDWGEDSGNPSGYGSDGGNNNDGTHDSIDSDRDNDGTHDSVDSDADNDGTHDSVDSDADNDGTHDSVDSDADNDGTHDSVDSDDGWDDDGW